MIEYRLIVDIPKNTNHIVIMGYNRNNKKVDKFHLSVIRTIKKRIKMYELRVVFDKKIYYVKILYLNIRSHKGVLKYEILGDESIDFM